MGPVDPKSLGGQPREHSPIAHSLIKTKNKNFLGISEKGRAPGRICNRLFKTRKEVWPQGWFSRALSSIPKCWVWLPHFSDEERGTKSGSDSQYLRALQVTSVSHGLTDSWLFAPITVQCHRCCGSHPKASWLLLSSSLTLATVPDMPGESSVS